MWEKILYWAGGTELVVGGVMQAYPGLLPMDVGFYIGWFMMALGLATVAAGFLLRSRKLAVSNERKSIFDQSINADNNSGTISPTYHNNVNFGITPTLMIQSDPDVRELPNGQTETIFRVKLTAPVSRLYLQAQGENLIDMIVARPAVGGVATISKAEVRKSRDSRCITESFANASGAYELRVTTSDGTPPIIAHQIEP